MELTACRVCENAISPLAHFCPSCGNVAQNHPQLNPTNVRVKTALLALFVGTLGFHKFYLNKSKLGLLYILLCWTLMPTIVSIIEGVIYCFQSDETFASRHLGKSN